MALSTATMSTNTTEKSSTCVRYSNPYSMGSELARLMIGSEGNPYFCDRRPKTFSTRGSLPSHNMQVHTTVKRYSCDLCPRSFSKIKSLTYHMRVHTGENPYSCALCPKSFSESGNLMKHMRVHTEEKPYSCDLCPKSFSQNGHLTYLYLRVHTGEKPYSCYLGPKTFSDSGCLISSIMVDHNYCREP